MFDVVLVADRGATAARVVSTCQALGASVVAVHSDVDAAAAHVRHADEAVPLGGSGFDESYGDPRKLVEAARRTGADAVHPGAGRLARDPAVARAVEDAGLAWLGLPAAVLARTDLHEVAAEAGLPPAAASDAVRALLTVTTVGDRGAVRQAWVAPEVTPDRPVAEQAPAPALDADAEQRLLAAAARLTVAAGTGPVASVTVVLDAGGTARFAGLAPPSSAGSAAVGAVLGVDVDEAQLVLAAGGTPQRREPVPAALALAVRARPAFAGRLRRWRLPQVDGVLVCSGVAEGAHVSAGSDRLLAVLTVLGDDVRAVEERAAKALAELEVEGVPTTLPLLRDAVDGRQRPAHSPAVVPPVTRSRSA